MIANQGHWDQPRGGHIERSEICLVRQLAAVRIGNFADDGCWHQCTSREQARCHCRGKQSLNGG